MSRDVDIQGMQLRELDELTTLLEEIRRKYDQYFIGLEKREPGPDRERFERALLKTKLLRSPIFVVRFKFQQFMARVRTYQSHWDRVLREIEEGTYRRGSSTQAERQAEQLSEAAVRRAQGVETGTVVADDAPVEARRIQNTAKSAEAFLASLLGGGSDKPPIAAAGPRTIPPRMVLTGERIEVPNVPASTAVTATPPPVPRTPPPPPAPRDPPPLQPPALPRAPAPPSPARASVDPVQKLFDDYVDAKRARGDDTTKLTLAGFSKSVDKQLDQARGQLGTDVELRVKVTADKVSVVAHKKK